MQLTAEQKQIIQSQGHIKINAVAGSGKTTTLIEYAKARPRNSRILYLAFNRTVKLEAERKFADAGLSHVRVETAHSLAYGHVVPRYRYKVRGLGYKPHELVDILGLSVGGDRHAEYVVAKHVADYFAYFCNSDKPKVQMLNYLDVVKDAKAAEFVALHYDYIQHQTRLLLAKMDKGELEVTHDFYLKKFQLMYPHLGYDTILFDEGQDASPAMLDVFLRQSAIKVIVGDTHQQIYGWRHAVNSLDKVGFATHHLSTSFRFGPDIARLAQGVLAMKHHLDMPHDVAIVGASRSDALTTKAVVARTNLGLLMKAIGYAVENQALKHIYFEGNIHSYTYADEGASLYDVLNLYNGNRALIKDPLLRMLKDVDDLETYIEQTGDAQLSMMLKMVVEYGNDIPDIIQTLKQKHVADGDRHKAQMVFSTVHRCKGMEYDTVHLADDFVTDEQLSQKANALDGNLDPAALNEEVNLLYVAVTRARNRVYIPEALLPCNMPASPHVAVMRAKPAKGADKAVERPRANRGDDPTLGYKPWTPKLDDRLTDMFCRGASVAELADHFERSRGAILSRIKKLELKEKYG